MNAMYKRHKGDDLRANDPRLIFKWTWSRNASGYTLLELRKWTHFQCSKADFGNWTMRTTQWHGKPVYYESSVEYGGSHIIASTGHNEESGITTRINAQLKAEQLLFDWISKEYKKIIKRYKKITLDK